MYIVTALLGSFPGRFDSSGRTDSADSRRKVRDIPLISYCCSLNLLGINLVSMTVSVAVGCCSGSMNSKT